jgi:hypothetical protein
MTVDQKSNTWTRSMVSQTIGFLAKIALDRPPNHSVMENA